MSFLTRWSVGSPLSSCITFLRGSLFFLSLGPMLREPSGMISRSTWSPGLRLIAETHSFGRDTVKVDRPVFCTFLDSIRLATIVYHPNNHCIYNM